MSRLAAGSVTTTFTNLGRRHFRTDLVGWKDFVGLGLVLKGYFLYIERSLVSRDASFENFGYWEKRFRRRPCIDRLKGNRARQQWSLVGAVSKDRSFLCQFGWSRRRRWGWMRTEKQTRFVVRDYFSHVRSSRSPGSHKKGSSSSLRMDPICTFTV